MRQLRELFTLHFEQHLPQRQIARSLGVARSTIERTLKRFTAAGLTWPLLSTLTDTELESALYRRRAQGVAARVQARPNYAAAVLELARKGVTRQQLWKEYRALHADGIGYAAALAGYRVKFFTASDLMSNLANAKRQERARSFGMQSLQSPRLLIIDELGYQPLSAEQAHELFQVIAKRYEKGSVLLTGNLNLGQWDQALGGNSSLAAALLDRLLHHCHSNTILNRLILAFKPSTFDRSKAAVGRAPTGQSG